MNTDITPVQAASLVAFMRGVASIDGLKPQEEVLITAFSEGISSELLKPSTSAQWIEGLKGVEELALQIGYLVGLCDGQLTDSEVQYIESVGKAMGVSADALVNARIAAKGMLIAELDNHHFDITMSVASKL